MAVGQPGTGRTRGNHLSSRETGVQVVWGGIKVGVTRAACKQRHRRCRLTPVVAIVRLEETSGEVSRGFHRLDRLDARPRLVNFATYVRFHPLFSSFRRGKERVPDREAGFVTNETLWFRPVYTRNRVKYSAHKRTRKLKTPGLYVQVVPEHVGGTRRTQRGKIMKKVAGERLLHGDPVSRPGHTRPHVSTIRLTNQVNVFSFTFSQVRKFRGSTWHARELWNGLPEVDRRCSQLLLLTVLLGFVYLLRKLLAFATRCLKRYGVSRFEQVSVVAEYSYSSIRCKWYWWRIFWMKVVEQSGEYKLDFLLGLLENQIECNNCLSA